MKITAMPADKSRVKYLVDAKVHRRSQFSALLDGFGSLLDIFPTAQQRRLRVFKGRVKFPVRVSVNEALSRDLAAVGCDFWVAIKAADEEVLEKAGSETCSAW
jgi:hypothetical protein